MKRIDPPSIYLTLDKNTLLFQGASGYIDTIHVSSNEDWVVDVSGDADWVRVSPMMGTYNGMFPITTTSDNRTAANRTTNINVHTKNNNASATITVVQLQYNATVLNAVFGGEGYDTFSDMTPTPDGGYIAVGTSASLEGDGAGSKGAADAWVVKFNGDGQKLWHKKFGGSLDDGAHSILRISADNYLILGTTLSTDGDVTNNKGDRDAWLFSIDGSGTLIWQKTLGGSGEDWLYNLKYAGNGNYLMCGWTKSHDGDVSVNAGEADAWLVSVNASGGIAWEKTYGGTGSDFAFDATPVSDGGFVFCGQVASNDGVAAGRNSNTPSAWFVKINEAHNVGGQVYLGQSESDIGTVAIEAGNGDYVFAGQTNTPGAFDNFHAEKDLFVCRIGPSGNVRWKKAYGGSLREQPGDLIETDSNDFILSGMTASSDGNVAANMGGDDGWLLRLNSDGEILNTAIVGGSQGDNISKVMPLTGSHFAFVGGTASFPDAYPDLDEVMHGWFQVIGLP